MGLLKKIVTTYELELEFCTSDRVAQVTVVMASGCLAAPDWNKIVESSPGFFRGFDLVWLSILSTGFFFAQPKNPAAFQNNPT